MNIQGTQKWLNERCGYATASRFAEIMAGGASRTKYLQQLVSENITLKPSESFSNQHTKRGTEQEPMAKAVYMERTGLTIQEVGFIKHATLRAGASPDALINDDGGMEVKSVIPSVQIETIRRGEYPKIHMPQVQGNLWITGRKWWDFVSFCEGMREGMNPALQLYVFRVERDDEYIDRLEMEVVKFLKEVDQEVLALLEA